MLTTEPLTQPPRGVPTHRGVSRADLPQGEVVRPIRSEAGSGALPQRPEPGARSVAWSTRSLDGRYSGRSPHLGACQCRHGPCPGGSYVRIQIIEPQVVAQFEIAPLRLVRGKMRGVGGVVLTGSGKMRRPTQPEDSLLWRQNMPVLEREFRFMESLHNWGNVLMLAVWSQSIMTSAIAKKATSSRQDELTKRNELMKKDMAPIWKEFKDSFPGNITAHEELAADMIIFIRNQLAHCHISSGRGSALFLPRQTSKKLLDKLKSAGWIETPTAGVSTPEMLTLMLQKIQAARALPMVSKRSRTIGLLPTSSMWRPCGWTKRPARLMNP